MNPSERPPGSGHIDSLQGLRALAALLVVVSHQLPLLGLPDDFDFYPGGVGVRIFFVISGFIMVTSAYDQFGAALAPTAFIWRRLIRIVPLYWLATALYATKLAITGNPPALDDLLRSFLFVPYLDQHGEFRPVYGLGWTLNYEMFFYILFAIALTQRFWVGITALSSTLLALVLFGAIGGDAVVGSPLITFWTDPVMLYFLAGVAAGLLRRPAIKLGLLQSEGVVGSFLISTLLITTFICATYFFPTLRHLEVVICVGAFAFCAFRAERQGRQSLVADWIVLAGNASYSIYLTHSFVAGPVKRFAVAALDGNYPIYLSGVVLLGSIVVGVASYLWIEKPALRFASSLPLRLRTT